MCLLACMGAALNARAQMALPVTNVDKARYDFLAPGIRAGSFLFSPGLAVDEIYDDNVYRENDEKSDFITVIKPSFGIASDFGRHALYFNSSAAVGSYKKYDDEDYKDYTIGGGGRLDFDYNTFISFASNYKRAHETRESLDDPNAAEPVEYSLTTHTLGFTRALGLIKLYVDGNYNRFEFEESKLPGGGTLDNSGRDREIYEVRTKLAYEYFPGYHVYTAARYDERVYDKKGTISRDSKGTEFTIGTDVELTSMLIGDVYVGRLRRDYDDSSLSGITATSYGGQLIWNMTGLTSLTARAERSVQETAYRDASGNLETRTSLELDHMLRYNVFLNGNVSYSKADYQGDADSDLTSDTYGAGLNLEYMPWDGTTFKIGYNYTQRETDIPNEDFKNNRFMLTLSKKF